MLHKTRGIVLGFIKYGDSSIITKIYTEAFGLKTYIVNSVRSKSSKNKIALFQSLTMLDLVVYEKQGRDINRISELKCHHIYKSIPFSQKKITIAMFITEILSKTLREEHEDPDLFELIVSSIHYLDEMEEHYENFHLQFLIKLASQLGFMASTAEDILNTTVAPLSTDEKKSLVLLVTARYSDHIPLSNSGRRAILDLILHFYSTHIDHFGTISSIGILREVLE